VTDCDGNTALQNLIGDGRCDNGQFYPYNFDCEEFAYDGGDCTPKNCHDQCVDAYPTDDGTCQEDFNCKKFEYSFQQCYTPECTDDWYDMGRDNYRCSQRTGGDRFASKKMTTFDECECYDFCQGKADEQGVTLNAFDNYSDKCRCWAGDCTDATTIACLDDGDRADEFSNTDGRCPSATYFPHDRELDCQDDADVTKYEGYFQANYHDDGFCDNKHFGDDREGGDDYSCVDGDDCAEATCDEIFEITGFAVLDEPNMVCDGHANEIVKEAEWTTACDCYTFCEPHIDSDMVMFQRDNNNMCQCLSGCDSQTNCGLESDCQIFTAERQTDCCGNDWTLGKLPSEINDGDYGEFWATHVDSAQGFALNQKVFTIDFMRSTSQAENLCIPEFIAKDIVTHSVHLKSLNMVSMTILMVSCQVLKLCQVPAWNAAWTRMPTLLLKRNLISGATRIPCQEITPTATLSSKIITLIQGQVIIQMTLMITAHAKYSAAWPNLRNML
jgi:hypothetical protein